MLVLVFSSLTAYASAYPNATPYPYTTTTAERNLIAYNWTYSSRGYAEQNCLSFALNKGNVWTWPWGTSNPTKSQAKTYLTNQGYNHFLNANEQGPLPNTPVHAYILNGRITHFSKNVSGAPVRAKWGKCEIFNHSNVDPYTNYVYGPLSFSSSK